MSDKNRTILCVGDDAFGLEIRRLVLESFGYHAIVEPDCAAALAVLAVRRIDLVVLDFAEFTDLHASHIRTLRERYPQQLMMLLAPFPYVDHDIESLVNCVITKGIAPEEFKIAVGKCLKPKSGGGKSAVILAFAGTLMGVASQLLLGHAWRTSTRTRVAQSSGQLPYACHSERSEESL